MKQTLLGLSMLVGALSSFTAMASENACVPDSAVICTINYSNVLNSDSVIAGEVDDGRSTLECYVRLSTTVQDVNDYGFGKHKQDSDVDESFCQSSFTTDKRNAVLAKARAQAKALAAAGVCKAVVDLTL